MVGWWSRVSAFPRARWPPPCASGAISRRQRTPSQPTGLDFFDPWREYSSLPLRSARAPWSGRIAARAGGEMRRTSTRRQALSRLGGAAFGLTGATVASDALAFKGVRAELVLTPVSTRTLRVSLLNVSNGAAVPVHDDPAIVAAGTGRPILRTRLVPRGKTLSWGGPPRQSCGGTTRHTDREQPRQAGPELPL
jgi:hypothetical protein